MKLSAKSDYAARAVIGLARRFPTGRAVKVEELAAENGVPPNYLVQILIELKARHIVKSVRGKLGASQAEFALMIGVSVATLRNWEQGRRTPEGPALALLRVAAKNPKAVVDALHGKKGAA